MAMDKRTRAALAVGATLFLFLCVQLGALALVKPFEQAGYQTVENPQDPTNSLLYVGAILVATVGMLAAIKFDVRGLIRGFIIFSSALISWYVFSIALPIPVALGAAALVGVALYVHPEWYVIDTAGILMGAGAAGLFGISFDVLPVIVLLTVLAVYDAVSVYGTEHMLTLAEGVMDLQVPILFVVPTTLPYSFTAAMSDDESEADGEETSADAESGSDAGDDAREGPLERDALFIGLGDAVMPTIMVASAAFFVDAPSLGVPGIALNLPALTAMVGSLAGLVVLLGMVLKGRPHAGLPLLNGGAIGGYLVGALAAGIDLSVALGIA